MNTNTTKVIVPCRFSYLHCWQPDSVNGGDPKYSVSAIVDKKDTKTVNAIKAAIEQAGITPTLRPEQLTVADFQHISRFGASLLDNPLKN